MTGLLLVLAGVAAGLSGSIAGLASLFSYPALLAVGLPATTANVTNTVALAFSTVGQVAGSRPELSGQWPVLRRLAPLTLLGGATGAGLLLVTPSEAFERIVPFLVGGAALVLLFQPRIRAVAARRGSPDAGPAVLGGIFAVAVYGGYFGAAAGVLMLALVLIGLPVGLARGNALKAVLLGLANAVAAVGFAVLGTVEWWAVPPLAIGVAIGGWCGPWVVRRLPAGPLRVGIALAGLGLAVWLAVQAY
ncbi:sulfite exporter TauE/SafE family protein [Pseudonocardia broussonetiae]|uniref:Probable membrane transporter protein n=1 Tax=Pseudonocardia broussonetiae TaxID=2736640 RepID=A0A6M6JS72_9PSEU|nr:sulfite exporter TauE/SafE family protein [Pseudonocardia broussonetiae]QJY50205.1 sulfite exporter TauE/SafE family protein [Pseudonocardia broussonetiae]